MRKTFLLSALACMAMSSANAETVVPLSFGNFDQWVTRHIKESAIIGGQEKKVFEKVLYITTDAFIDEFIKYVRGSQSQNEESLKEENYSYPVGTYSIDDKRLQKERRGLNIIRMNDGKAIKRIVK